jgi:hypothetical protein
MGKESSAIESEGEEGSEYEDSSSEEEEYIEGELFRYEKCGKSSVDNAIVAISRWHNRRMWSHEGEDWFDQAELFVAIALYLATLCIQAIILGIFYKTWIEPKDDPYEETYYHAMSAAIKNATKLGISLHNNTALAASEASTYCMLNRATPLLHLVVLWIWFGEGLELIATSLWRCIIVWNFAEHHGDAEGQHVQRHQLKEVSLDPTPAEKNVKIPVQTMSPRHKMLTTILILAPNLFFSILLAWFGATYISVTTEINFLVKASLKMNFIARIDKLIMPCYASVNWAEYVASSTYKTPDPSGGVAFFDTWIVTWLKGVLGLVASWWCSSMIWPQIEDFRMLCSSYYEMFPMENAFPGKKVNIPVSNVTDGWWYPEM